MNSSDLLKRSTAGIAVEEYHFLLAAVRAQVEQRLLKDASEDKPQHWQRKGAGAGEPLVLLLYL